MTKELEAFRTIELFFSVEKVNTIKPYVWQSIKSLLPKECKIVETALKRLENYDKDDLLYALAHYLKGNNYNIEYISKSLKALEIIKQKRVNCLVLILSQTYVEYNDMCENEKDKLTKEEYDLLRKVLL